MKNNDSLQNNSVTTTVLTVMILAISFSPIFSDSISTSFSATSAEVGFQDGLSDCQSGTSNAINNHPNAGHHSAAYMEAYNKGLASCSKTGSNTNQGFTSGNTESTSTPIAPQQQQSIQQSPAPNQASSATEAIIPVTPQSTLNGNNDSIQADETTTAPDFNSICNTLQTGLYDSCSQLVDTNGILTSAGNTTIKCIITSALLNIGSTVLQIPPSFINNTLTNFSDPTGCGGVVKIDQLNSILSGTGNVKGIVNQLIRLIQ
jgi:hypothetical protein